MKLIKYLLMLIIVLVYCLTASAQTNPTWATTYVANLPISISQNDMTTDGNGNVYIVGYTTDTAYKVTTVTLKYDTHGQFQWIQYYDSISYYTQIAVDNIGNVFISGHSTNDGLLTIKYNTQGVLQWAKPFASSSLSVWSYDIIADSFGDIYMTGLSNGNRITTLKYNTLGVLQWAAVDSVVGGSAKSFVTVDNNKNVYVACRKDTVGYACTSNTIKYNSLGIKQWERVYTSNFNPGLSGPVDIKYTKGFVYLLACSTNNNNGDGDYVVVKYDTLGNRLWTLPYSFTTYYDVPNSMAIDKTGNVYVTGTIWPTGGTVDSIATIKISNAGVVVWKKLYSLGYSNNDEPCGIAIDSIGYIIVAGKSSDSFSHENYVAIKYDSLGNEIWVGRYHNTTYSSDVANSLSLDKFGDIYLSGTTYDNNSSGILTIKYSNVVGIQELINNSNNIVNIYPNPFEASLTIKANKFLKNADLVIYDEFGKEVMKIININYQTLCIQRENLASGIYFFRLNENNQIIAKGKIIAQ